MAKNNFLVEVTFKFFGVFRGYKMGTLSRNGLKLALGSVESRIVLTFFFLLFPFDSPQNIIKPDVFKGGGGGRGRGGGGTLRRKRLTSKYFNNDCKLF